MSPFRIILNIIISASISVFILALFLFYISHQGGSISLTKVIDLIKNVSLPILATYLFIYLLGTWFRAKRFQKIISADKDSPIPGSRNIYIVTMIRNMVVDLLPSRSGELFYIGLVKKSDNVPTATSASSLGMSIWLDLVVLGLLIIGIALFGIATGAFDVNIEIKWLFILAFVIVSFPIGLWLIHKWRSRFALAEKLYQFRVFAWFFRLLETSRQSMKKDIFLPSLLLSFGVRICKYLGMYLIFMAVVNGVDEIAEQFNGINAFDVLITLVASEFTASLPVPALMSFGTYEAGGTFALTQLGIATAVAALVLLSTHIISQLIDYIMGGIGMILYWTLGLARFKNDKAVSAEEIHQNNEKKSWLKFFSIKQLAILTVAGLVGIGSLLFAYQGYQEYKFSKTLTPPEPGNVSAQFNELAPTAQQNLTALFAGTNKKGFMVWSSNRFGNHDILKMSLPDMTITRLTDHKHTEGFPRLSPNGKYLTFARAHLPWLSWRNHTDWDIILYNMETGEERVLVKNGFQATWDNDGEHVYYVSDGGFGLSKININSGAITQKFIAGEGDWPANMSLHTPSYNEKTNNFALNYRKPLPIAGFLEMDNNNKRLNIESNACQTTWADDNSFAYYVKSGSGRMKNEFMKYDYASGVSTQWLDMPGEFSHEYFPKLSSDNSLLVFGASAGGHEHDTEDYELFIWPVDKPATEAIRLTFHTGNDNWPDIFIE